MSSCLLVEEKATEMRLHITVPACVVPPASYVQLVLHSRTNFHPWHPTLHQHLFSQGACAGCASGEIYLCQFGETKAKAGYTPMPAHLEAPAPSPQSLFTTPPKSWNPSPGVNFTHWGQPQAVSLSDSLPCLMHIILPIQTCAHL